jgi:hypothetical protein
VASARSSSDERADVAGSRSHKLRKGVDLSPDRRRLRRGYPEQSMLITGLRGVGKTVLLGAFESRARASGWVTVTAEITKNEEFGARMGSMVRRALFQVGPKSSWTDKLRQRAAGRRCACRTRRRTGRQLRSGCNRRDRRLHRGLSLLPPEIGKDRLGPRPRERTDQRTRRPGSTTRGRSETRRIVLPRPRRTRHRTRAPVPTRDGRARPR